MRLLRAIEAAACHGADLQWQLALLVALRSSSYFPLAKSASDWPILSIDALDARVVDVIRQTGRATTLAYNRNGPPRRLICEPAEVSMGLPSDLFTGIERAQMLLRTLPWFNEFMGYLCALGISDPENRTPLGM